MRELCRACVVLLAFVGPLCAAPAPFIRTKPMDPRQERAAYATLVSDLKRFGVSVSKLERGETGGWDVTFEFGGGPPAIVLNVTAPDRAAALRAVRAEDRDFMVDRVAGARPRAELM